jgi:hypothetical protein
MSDTTLDHLHKRLADLRIDSVMIRGRIEELVQTIEMLERRRGGRPRKGSQIAIVPQRVAGASAETETDEQLFPEDAAQ